MRPVRPLRGMRSPGFLVHGDVEPAPSGKGPSAQARDSKIVIVDRSILPQGLPLPPETCGLLSRTAAQAALPRPFREETGADRRRDSQRRGVGLAMSGGNSGKTKICVFWRMSVRASSFFQRRRKREKSFLPQEEFRRPGNRRQPRPPRLRSAEKPKDATHKKGLATVVGRTPRGVAETLRTASFCARQHRTQPSLPRRRFRSGRILLRPGLFFRHHLHHVHVGPDVHARPRAHGKEPERLEAFQQNGMEGDALEKVGKVGFPVLLFLGGFAGSVLREDRRFAPGRRNERRQGVTALVSQIFAPDLGCFRLGESASLRVTQKDAGRVPGVRPVRRLLVETFRPAASFFGVVHDADALVRQQKRSARRSASGVSAGRRSVVSPHSRAVTTR